MVSKEELFWKREAESMENRDDLRQGHPQNPAPTESPTPRKAAPKRKRKPKSKPNPDI